MALAAAVVAIAALAACSSATITPVAEPALAPSSAAVASTPAPPAELTVAEFVDRFGPATGDMVWLSGAEVEDEFHAAAAAFPLDLPAGYTWPTEMSRSLGTVTEWQRGTGVAEAYLYWEAAHATAAYAAWRSGDMVSAVAQVEVLVDGYASAIRSMYVDPEEAGTDSEYYRSVLEPALNGHLEPLVHAQVASFISTDEYLAIAAQAGDVIQVGSEGFSRSVDDQPGDPGYIEDVRVELEHRIPSE
jgi:hypothetical protein